MVELVRGRSGCADPRKGVQEAMREKRKPSSFEKKTCCDVVNPKLVLGWNASTEGVWVGQ